MIYTHTYNNTTDEITNLFYNNGIQNNLVNSSGDQVYNKYQCGDGFPQSDNHWSQNSSVQYPTPDFNM